MYWALLMHFGPRSGSERPSQYESGMLSNTSLNALLTRHWFVFLQNPVLVCCQFVFMSTCTHLTPGSDWANTDVTNSSITIILTTDLPTTDLLNTDINFIGIYTI